MSSEAGQRTAIVTGASRGIGRGIARALGSTGCRVAINYNANAEAAEAAAEEVTRAGGEALTVQADVGQAADRERLVTETIEHFGPIDLLVNNAGIAPRVRADMLEMSEESYDEVMAVNLKGPLLLTQQVANHMIERRDTFPESIIPAIVNVTSVSADTVSTNRAEYCISKAGQAMTTQLFAARLAEHGILVYELRPGATETDMTAGVKEKYDRLIFEEKAVPIQRWGQPEDVGKAVLAIAKGLLPYSTGQIITIDGGFHIKQL